MDEEKVCFYCEEPIQGEDYRVLGDDKIVCKSCFEPVCYEISVTIDASGTITAISRLTASMLLSEGCTSSDWRPYRIDSKDYSFWAEDLIEENFEFEDE